MSKKDLSKKDLEHMIARVQRMIAHYNKNGNGGWFVLTLEMVEKNLKQRLAKAQ